MPLEAHTVSCCCWIAAVDARADDLAAQRLALDIELMQDVAQLRALLAAAARSAAGEIHRSSLPRFSMLDMCRPHRSPRHRQELLLVAAEGESGKQQTFRRDAANVPACGPPGWGDRERANDIAAPMAAKAASRKCTQGKWAQFSTSVCRANVPAPLCVWQETPQWRTPWDDITEKADLQLKGSKPSNVRRIEHAINQMQ
jgi:hypothetical protein